MPIERGSVQVSVFVCMFFFPFTVLVSAFFYSLSCFLFIRIYIWFSEWTNEKMTWCEYSGIEISWRDSAFKSHYVKHCAKKQLNFVVFIQKSLFWFKLKKKKCEQCILQEHVVKIDLHSGVFHLLMLLKAKARKIWLNMSRIGSSFSRSKALFEDLNSHSDWIGNYSPKIEEDRSQSIGYQFEIEQSSHHCSKMTEIKIN